jgi:hypothetical protein
LFLADVDGFARHFARLKPVGVFAAFRRDSLEGLRKVGRGACLRPEKLLHPVHERLRLGVVVLVGEVTSRNFMQLFKQ